MPIDLSLGFFAKYEGRSIEDVADDVDHPRSSTFQKVNPCNSSFEEESYYRLFSNLNFCDYYYISKIN